MTETMEAAVSAAASAILRALTAQTDKIAAWEPRQSTPATLQARLDAVASLVDQLDRLRAEPRVVDVLRYDTPPPEPEAWTLPDHREEE